MADFTKIRLIDDYLSSVSGSITVTGSITATTFTGDGSGLNGIDASLLDFSNVPISSSGLPTGSVYLESGFLKISE